MVDKFKHRTALAVRELQQAQKELWALRGASTGQLPTDMEQDFIALKKKVIFIIFYLLDVYLHFYAVVRYRTESGNSSLRNCGLFRVGG